MQLKSVSFTFKKVKQVFLASILILGLNFFFIQKISAQDITFNVKSYKGGYNVSCKSSTDGSIDATIVGGTTPYSYSWSNGSTTQDLSNIPAGVYTLTVTDALGSSKSKSITLFEADLIEVFLTTSVYEGGYQISKMGSNDGSITTDVKGGAPPYKYLWNNGSQKSNLDKLVAGSYSVIVTDQNGCSVTKNVTLLEPTPLTATLTATTYGAYNTHCFESKDGNINLTVSGGMPPYRYNWNNGSFEEDLSNVAAGVYKVEVTDANKAITSGQITITQPTKLVLGLTPFIYSNNYNISCTGCFNGSITTIVTGGIAPYTYLWKGPGTATGQTTPGLTGAGPGDYSVVITDANGCRVQDKAFLSEPAANAWDKSGSIADPTNFLGTTNIAPLVFKTSNIERMRITETGNAIFSGSATVNGDLKTMGSLTFGGNRTFTYTPATVGGSPAVLGFGVPIDVVGPPPLFPYDDCDAPIPHTVPSSTITQFPGLIESYSTTASATNNNMMTMGFDGANGIIDVAGYTALGNPGLLINYNCGKDVYVCTGANGGEINMSSGANGGNVNICSGASGNVLLANGPGTRVGIATTSPTAKFEIQNDNPALKTMCISKVVSPTQTRRMIFEPKMNFGDYNYLTQAGDMGIIWSDGSSTPSSEPTGFVLAHWGGGGTGYPYSGLRMTKDGFIGIGTPNPQAMMEIQNGEYVGGPGVRNPVGLKVTSTYLNNPALGIGILCQVGDDKSKTFSSGKTDGSDYTENFVVFGDGHVFARDIKVTLETPFSHPDYVFEKEYKLKTLQEVELFIKQNGHLPNIPSAKEVEKSNGISLGEMSEKQLLKIEELTLYIIEMNKKMSELAIAVELQKDEIKTLKNK